METQLGKNHQSQLLIDFYSSIVSLVRSQRPYKSLQNTLLGVTLLEDLITLLGVALLEDFRKFH